jgi:dihydrofolate reductase
MQHGLIDEFVLMIHPLVLGQGRRFFDNDSPLTNFKLATLLTTDTGAIIGAYLRK